MFILLLEIPLYSNGIDKQNQFTPERPPLIPSRVKGERTTMITYITLCIPVCIQYRTIEELICLREGNAYGMINNVNHTLDDFLYKLHIVWWFHRTLPSLLLMYDTLLMSTTLASLAKK